MKISNLVINITDVEDALVLKNRSFIEGIFSLANNVVQQGGKITIQRVYSNADPDILFVFSTTEQINSWKNSLNSAVEIGTLVEAVKSVIEHNKSMGYPPGSFIIETEEGNAVNLREVIARLVLNPEVLAKIENSMRQTGCRLLTIEDLITLKADGFNFSEDVKREAKTRSQWFDQQFGRITIYMP